MEEIGRVELIRRYPVKGMRGEDLDEAKVTSSGILGDRVYAYVDNNAPNPRFPWMTSRQGRSLLLFKPRFVLAPSEVEVEVSDGTKYSIKDEKLKKLIEDKYGYSLSLKFNPEGCFDSESISLFSLDTLHELEKETSISLDQRRFRANFYVSWASRKPFFEDELVGGTLRIGPEVIIKVVEKDSRCVVPTLDPETASESPQLLKVIQKSHRGCAGVYAEVVRQGRVAVDDPIFIA